MPFLCCGKKNEVVIEPSACSTPREVATEQKIETPRARETVKENGLKMTSGVENKKFLTFF